MLDAGCWMLDAGSLLSKTASREADSDLTGGGIAAAVAVAATSDSNQRQRSEAAAATASSLTGIYN